MPTLYPAQQDDDTTLADPTGNTNTLNSSPTHSELHDNVNDAVKALEAKLGYGSAQQVASAATVLLGTGTGASQWSSTIPYSMLTGVPAVSVPDASTSTKGIVKLAGDLGGTAALPTVPGLANKVSKGLLFIDARDYGVVGDGAADDLAALNAFWAACANAVHGYIPAPSVRYNISGAMSVPSNVDVKIADGALFYLTADAAAMLKNSDQVGGNVNIKIDGGYFQGNKASRTAGGRNRGLYFFVTDGLILKNMVIDGVEDHGLQLVTVNHYELDYVIAKNCGKDAGLSTGGSGIAISTIDNLYGGSVLNCWGIDNLRCGIKIGHGFTGPTVEIYAPINVVGFHATGNGNDGSSGGIALVGNGSANTLRGVTLSGCNSWSNHYAGYLIETGLQASPINNCNALFNGTHGFEFYQAVAYSTITGCNAYNNSQTAAGVSSGFYLHDGGVGCTNNVFVGCVATDTQSVKTQKYGFEEANLSNYNYFASCNFTGNLTGDYVLTGTFSGGLSYSVGVLTFIASLALEGSVDRNFTMGRNTNTNSTAVGRALTLQAGGAPSGKSNSTGGSLVLSSGISTGNRRSNIFFSTPVSATAGTTDNTPTNQAVLFAASSNGPIFALGNVNAGVTGLMLNSNAYALSGRVAAALQMYRHTTANSAGNNLSIYSGGATSGATNKAAGDLVLSTGTSTGSGGANVLIKTPTPTASGLTALLSATVATEGSGYTAGDVLGVSGGTGGQVTVSTVAVAGSIATVAINAAGAGYAFGDVLTVSGGTATVTVTDVNALGNIQGLTLTTVGSGYSNGTGVSLTGGTGTGATGNVTVHATGGVTGVSVTTPGTGYTVSTSASTTGGTGTGATLSILTGAEGDNSLATRVTVSNTAVDVTGLPITSVADPTNAQDAATKNYVDTQTTLKTYTLQTSGAALSPTDATTYYFGGNFGGAPGTTADLARVYIPKAGTIKAAYAFFTQAVGASNETSTINIRLNNTTDYAISAAVVNNAVSTAVNGTSLNSGAGIPVAAGDYIEIKWVTPTWATNPTGVRASVVLYIE